MIDINLLRNNIDEVESKLNLRGFKIDKKIFIFFSNLIEVDFIPILRSSLIS